MPNTPSNTRGRGAACRPGACARLLRASLIATLALGCSLPAVTQEPRATTQKVILLHTNDLHFDFNHLDSVEAKIERFRRQYAHVFLFDAGDFSNRPSRWRDGMDAAGYAERLTFMIETMNRLAYDAVTLGNHDLGYYHNVTRDILRRARFPFLGANVQVTTDLFDAPLPFLRLETDSGLSMIVLGLSGGSFDRAEGIMLANLSQTLSEYAYLREDADAFILLTHIGHGADRRLADRHGEMLDVIIGGHSHTQINPAELRNGVLIAQTGGHSHAMDPDRKQYLGVIRLVFNTQGELLEKEGEVLAFDAVGHTASQFLETRAAGVR